MGEAELVLQNRLAIDQRLDFIGEGVEGLGQSLGKECVGHPINRGGGDVGEGSHWSGVGASMTAELGKLGLWGVWGWCVARRKKGGKGSIGQLFFLRLGQVQARPHLLLRAECLAGSGARGASGGPTGGHCSTTCTRFPGQDGGRPVDAGIPWPVVMFLSRYALASRLCPVYLWCLQFLFHLEKEVNDPGLGRL